MFRRVAILACIFLLVLLVGSGNIVAQQASTAEVCQEYDRRASEQSAITEASFDAYLRAHDKIAPLRRELKSYVLQLQAKFDISSARFGAPISARSRRSASPPRLDAVLVSWAWRCQRNRACSRGAAAARLTIRAPV